jgi:hypothetical protein
MELLWKIVSAIILALVEGITEFLPVSSTGHMILVRELLDLDVPPGGVFEVFIQFGAILSICLIYFDYLWKVTKAVPFNENARRFAFGLFVAFLPAAILGVLLSDFITTYLFSKYVVAVSLVVGGFAILYIERLVKIPAVLFGRGFSAFALPENRVVPMRRDDPRRLALGRDHHGLAAHEGGAQCGCRVFVLSCDPDDVRSVSLLALQALA